MPTLLVPGDAAPPIQSQAVRRGEVVDLSLEDALQGAEYLLLVFYPADFTFVCPTEIVQFSEKHAQFEEQRCNIVCCSTDSVYTHLAWLRAPKAERGLGAASSSSLVLLSDRSHEISSAYGVLASSGAAYRGTFLIDRNKTICQVTINDMPVGRSVDDALRMLTELRTSASKGAIGEPTGPPNDRQVNSSNARPSLLELNRQNHMSQQRQPRRRQPRQQEQQQQQHSRQRLDDQHDQLQCTRTIPQILSNAKSNPLGDDVGASPRPDTLWPGDPMKLLRSSQCQEQLRRSLSRPGGQHQPQQQPQQQQHQGPLAAKAAQLETQAAQLRLRDSEQRLARLLADADRLRTETDRQRVDTERLKTQARLRQTEWSRMLRRS